MFFAYLETYGGMLLMIWGLINVGIKALENFHLEQLYAASAGETEEDLAMRQALAWAAIKATLSAALWGMGASGAYWISQQGRALFKA